MNPSEQQQKIIAKGATAGILRAVGILALLGLVAAMVFGIGKADFSSGLAPSLPTVPVTMLLTNETPDSLTIGLRSKDGAIVGQRVTPPSKTTTCERFNVHVTPGKPYFASLEIRDLHSGRRDTSAWFNLNFGRALWSGWIDTVRPGRRYGVLPVGDLNVLVEANGEP
jgi:hypothetical protein